MDVARADINTVGLTNVVCQVGLAQEAVAAALPGRDCHVVARWMVDSVALPVVFDAVLADPSHFVGGALRRS